MIAGLSLTAERHFVGVAARARGGKIRVAGRGAGRLCQRPGTNRNGEYRRRQDELSHGHAPLVEIAAQIAARYHWSKPNANDPQIFSPLRIVLVDDGWTAATAAKKRPARRNGPSAF